MATKKNKTEQITENTDAKIDSIENVEDAQEVEEPKEEKIKEIDCCLEFLKENYEFYKADSGLYYYSEKGAAFVNLLSDSSSSRLVKATRAYSHPYGNPISESVASLAVSIMIDIIDTKIEAGEEKPIIIEPRIIQEKKTKNVYIDTNSPSGIIKIDTDGTWEMGEEQPEGARFSRSGLTGEMLVDDCELSKEGYDNLFNHLNVPDKMRNIVLSWAVMRFVMPTSTCPMLTIVGEKGSGKTTTGSRLKNLVDPMGIGIDSEALEGLPRTLENLDMRTIGSSCIIYDNIDSIPQTISDALCRVVTGGGSVNRQFYTNQGLVINRYKRAQIMTAVEMPVMKADLQSRSILIQPGKITGMYRSEEEMKEEWEEALPELRGFIFSLAAEVKSRIKGTTHKPLSRLSDFTVIIQIVDDVIDEFCGVNIDSAKVFSDVNRDQAHEALPDIVRFMISSDSVIDIEGYPEQILGKLKNKAENENVSTKTWGSTGRWIANIFRDHMSVIEEHFEVTIEKKRRGKHYTISRVSSDRDETLDEMEQFLA